jgi:hypothetical protein
MIATLCATYIELGLFNSASNSALVANFFAIVHASVSTLFTVILTSCFAVVVVVVVVFGGGVPGVVPSFAHASYISAVISSRANLHVNNVSVSGIVSPALRSIAASIFATSLSELKVISSMLVEFISLISKAIAAFFIVLCASGLFLILAALPQSSLKSFFNSLIAPALFHSSHILLILSAATPAAALRLQTPHAAHQSQVSFINFVALSDCLPAAEVCKLDPITFREDALWAPLPVGIIGA